VPEDPAIALQNALKVMDAFPRHAVLDVERWDLMRLLASRTQSLIAPVLSRTSAYSEFTLACARLALLSAAALSQTMNREDVATHLLEALRGLTALRSRALGDLLANEVLILVRI
jgi:hypothetical protein